ncbi:MAG: DUF2298 domain-containing protein [Candidatus Goldiibacteriota bacterium]
MALFFGQMIHWWFVSVLIGVMAVPVSFMIFRKSHDRGYMFSKIIGIFLIGYFSWIIGFAAFNTAVIYGVILAISGVSAYIFIKNREKILTELKERTGLIIITELFFLFVFLAYGFFRMYQPDIVGTEKFMDFAFMNAITRADSMPPYDPWMSGVSEAGRQLHMSYYYFGYFMMALMFKLTGIAPGSAYNLAVIYTVALSALAVTGLLFNITKNYLIGFLGAAFLLVISNLDGFIQVVSAGWSTNGFNWWTSSRIIDYPGYDITINEFPFFSFLLGDLHPHQMAIPFVLLALNTAFYFIKTGKKRLFEKNISSISLLVFSGLVLGGLWFINSWDFPTYFFVTMLCILSYKYSLSEKKEDSIKDTGKAAAVILAAAVIPYLPFSLFHGSQVKGIGLVKANTQLKDYLTIFGVMLFPILTFLLFRFINWTFAMKLQGAAGSKVRKREEFCPRCGRVIREGKKICGGCGYRITGDEMLLGGEELPVKKSNKTVMSFVKLFVDPSAPKDNKIYIFAGGAFALALAFVVFKSLMDPPNIGVFIGIMFLLAAFVVLMGSTKTEHPENQFVIILIFTGFFASFGCEFLRIVDTFSRPGQHVPLERMNTVFKFYYQTWILFSVAAAYGFFWVKHFYLRFKPGYFRWIYYSVFTTLIIMGLFYPFAAGKVKTDNYSKGLSLNGTDFLQWRKYEGRIPAMDDWLVIKWINNNVEGNPVVLEAWGGQYTEYARISSFTGLPTVIGWPGHELQWRGSGDEAGRRQAVVNKIYETLDENEAMELIEKYNIEYVYVGPLEREKYNNSPGLNKFSDFMSIVYTTQNGSVLYQAKKSDVRAAP